MGLFDSVKAKAGELAADAERAGKVAAAQARVVTLQNEVRKAERDLGRAAYELIAAGEAVHPDLLAAAVAVDEAYEALQAKEQEIASLRRESPAGNAATVATITYPVTPSAPAGQPEPAAEVVAAPDQPAEPAQEAPAHPLEAPARPASGASPAPPVHPEAHTGHTPAEEAR